MFSSLLRRPKNGSRRVDIRDASLSPSSRPPPRLQFAGRKHATADFTEADDDEEDESNDERTNRFGPEEGEDAPDDGPEVEADEDGGQKALPVLPLFSATHLGNIRYPLGLCCRSVVANSLRPPPQTPCRSTASPMPFASSCPPAPRRP